MNAATCCGAHAEKGIVALSGSASTRHSGLALDSAILLGRSLAYVVLVGFVLPRLMLSC